MVKRFLVSTLACGAALAQLPGLPSSDSWQSHMDLGKRLEVRGQYAEAKQEFQAALEAAKPHPKGGRSFLSAVELGTVAAAMGQYVEAEQWDNEAVRHGLAIYGNESPELALAYTNLAAVYRDQGEYRRAEEFCRRALRLARGQGPLAAAARAQVLGALGGILSELGKLPEAEESLQQSVALAETLPPPSEILAGDWNNLAGLYAKMGRLDEALAMYRKAYALCTQIGGNTDPNLFFILAGMAAIQAQSGQYKEAVSGIQSGIELAESGGSVNTIQLRNALLAEAEWLHKLKREPEAKRVRAKAKQVAQAAAQNSYAQYTVDARQVAQGMVKQPE